MSLRLLAWFGLEVSVMVKALMPSYPFIEALEDTLIGSKGVECEGIMMAILLIVENIIGLFQAQSSTWWRVVVIII